MNDDEVVVRRVLLSTLSCLAWMGLTPALHAMPGRGWADAAFQTRPPIVKGWSHQGAEASRLVPGKPVHEVLAIQSSNSGANYLLSGITRRDRAFARHLDVKVTRRDDNITLYAGPLSGLHGLELGRLPANSSIVLDLTVTLQPSTAAAVLEGRSALEVFAATATQT